MTAEEISELTKELEKIFVTKTEFETPRRILVTGDASGSVEFKGKENATITIKVNRSATAKLANTALEITSVKNAMSAISAATADVASRCTGNSATATKLKDGRSLIFTGDVTAETIFDGSKDLIVDVKVRKAESATTDEDGNNIVATYAKKSALPQIELQMAEYDEKPCLLAYYEGKLYRFIGEEVY